MENINLYYITIVGFLSLIAFSMLLILRGLKITLKRTEFSNQKQNKIFFQGVFVVLFWLGLTGILSAFGVLEMNEQKPVIPPPLLVLVNIPLIVLLFFINLSKTVKEIIKVIPSHWLVYFQSFRIVVEILLWLLFVQNLLPIQMTFEGKNFDILVGVLAIPAGYFVAKQTSIKAKKKLLIVWNIFGLCVLAIIVSIAVLSAPLPIRYFMNEPSSKVVSTFPFVWLPTVLVVIAYSLHILSLKQAFLIKEKS